MAEVFHGGGLDAAIARYGGAREDWLDLSTGINPNPYQFGEISKEIWTRLPDTNAENALLAAARDYYHVQESFKVVAAPGTQALIQLLPKILGSKEIGIVSPTYGEHAHVWRSAGANIHLFETLEIVGDEVDVAVVVNPNNPDCRIHKAETLQELANKVKWLIVDEAFCDPYPESSLVPYLPQNAIVLRSFGKFFGLAGLRLGFAIANDQKATELEQALGPWAVSGPALAIGEVALRDREWINKSRTDLQTKAADLKEVLVAAGLEVKGVNPLFVYAYHPEAGTIFERLAMRQILVRPFPENPGYMRFGLCENHEELNRLKQALEVL